VQTCIAETELTGDVSGPAEARQFAWSVLESWGWEASRGGLNVVLTELVTNAIRHGEGQMRILLELREKCLRIGVGDDSATMPAPRPPGTDGGFGLGLVEKMCARWYADLIPNDGKTVWCECPDASPPVVAAR
jgi:anti-sigma regulatory factor (Ser/Thr protein kinase)